MNVEEIKKKVDEAVPSLENTPELCYLISIIEQAEKALGDIEHISSPRIYDFAINQLAWKALQAIRGEL